MIELSSEVQGKMDRLIPQLSEAFGCSKDEMLLLLGIYVFTTMGEIRAEFLMIDVFTNESDDNG